MQNVLKKIETDFENRIKLIDKEVYSGKTRNLNEQGKMNVFMLSVNTMEGH